MRGIWLKRLFLANEAVKRRADEAAAIKTSYDDVEKDWIVSR